jgi:hypothetical protein
MEAHTGKVVSAKKPLPTPVLCEVGTIYRACDGRRYVNKRSAMLHSAMVFLRESRCLCRKGKPLGQADCDPEDCPYHSWKYDDLMKKSVLSLYRFWMRKQKEPQS